MFAFIRPLAALGVLELLEDFMKYSFADFSQHEKSRISFKFLAPLKDFFQILSAIQGFLLNS
jgi:hypothetical protein